MFKNPFQVAVTFAIIALIIKIVVFLTGYQHGVMETGIRYIYMLLLLTTVFFGMRSGKILTSGTTKFMDDFKWGARTAAYFAMIVAIITYVYYSKIDVNFFTIKQKPIFDEYLLEASKALKTKPKKEVITTLSNQIYGMRTFLSPYFQAMWTLFGLVFMGMFDALIFAFLMKKFPGYKK